ncbi:hypothetical protein [Brevundimonas sp. UBA2416]|uniref:hypothetical protein n=1 Tax=Brevundimonas sp. UBA2416 TaxID=1946124 RepID=UPI0025BA19E6|nr:hypothetical protein [Brevundimonas sp. UBA2416]HRJ62831.1 hypothetical protein [Brevundimonas sp.]
MSARHLIVVAAVAASLAACETVPMGDSGLGPRPASTAFSAEDFAWSAGSGRGSIDGRVAFSRDGQAFTCTGSVALTPDTPYTRARFQTLYGSTDRAAIPEAVVRARTVPDPNADYRSFVRSTTCQNGRFEFSGLPDGDWFIITPVSAGGDRIVLMRHIGTRGGRVSVTL